LATPLLGPSIGARAGTEVWSVFGREMSALVGVGVPYRGVYLRD
jgi:hypothetical protein